MLCRTNGWASVLSRDTGCGSILCRIAGSGSDGAHGEVRAASGASRVTDTRDVGACVDAFDGARCGTAVACVDALEGARCGPGTTLGVVDARDEGRSVAAVSAGASGACAVASGACAVARGASAVPRGALSALGASLSAGGALVGGCSADAACCDDAAAGARADGGMSCGARWTTATVDEGARPARTIRNWLSLRSMGSEWRNVRPPWSSVARYDSGTVSWTMNHAPVDDGVCVPLATPVSLAAEAIETERLASESSAFTPGVRQIWSTAKLALRCTPSSRLLHPLPIR